MRDDLEVKDESTEMPMLHCCCCYTCSHHHHHHHHFNVLIRPTKI